tara:strand:+ start:85 stop:633 length:549 start_codon:yes stop_codon:yes gene_type:complete
MIYGKRIYLREIKAEDINQKYLSWMNNSNVNAFLETRFVNQTLESLKDYWLRIKKDENSFWFAICTKDDDMHIGNIKIGPVNWIHKKGDLSLFIGDSKKWGKGYGYDSIILISKWSFKHLKLEKINAGIYESNAKSIKAFEKAGFKVEGILREEVKLNSKRENVLRYGLLKNEYKVDNKVIN